jgi:hypothetical protein
MTPWDYVADISAAIGGIAALLGIIIGSRALGDSHSARLEAARDRQRKHLERIADDLDRLERAALLDTSYSPPRNDWRDNIGLLNRYLDTTTVRLPKCRKVAEQGSAGHPRRQGRDPRRAGPTRRRGRRSDRTATVAARPDLAASHASRQASDRAAG